MNMKRNILASFYPLKVLCNTSFVSTMNWFSFISVIFPQIKEIMNVNRRIILVSKICYDKIDDYCQLYADFIT